eukprot:3813524-Alexandrium_andersonii.AAC.1
MCLSLADVIGNACMLGSALTQGIEGDREGTVDESLLKIGYGLIREAQRGNFVERGVAASK